MPKFKGADAFWRDDDIFRETAALVLIASTIVGMFGLFISSLAAIWTYGDFRRGEISAMDFGVLFTAWAMLPLCPLAGWFSLARGKARLAIAVASPPLLLAIGGLAVVVLGG